MSFIALCSPIYKDLVERAVSIEKNTLREILLDDPEEDLDLFSEEGINSV